MGWYCTHNKPPPPPIKPKDHKPTATYPWNDWQLCWSFELSNIKNKQFLRTVSGPSIPRKDARSASLLTQTSNPPFSLSYEKSFSITEKEQGTHEEPFFLKVHFFHSMKFSWSFRPPFTPCTPKFTPTASLESPVHSWYVLETGEPGGTSHECREKKMKNHTQTLTRFGSGSMHHNVSLYIL